MVEVVQSPDFATPGKHYNVEKFTSYLNFTVTSEQYYEQNCRGIVELRQQGFRFIKLK